MPLDVQWRNREKRTDKDIKDKDRSLGLQSWRKGCRQIEEIKQNRVFYRMFYS